MIASRSIRFRMMVLFSAVVGVLLAASYLEFYEVFTRIEREQFDRRLVESAGPVVADLIADPTEEDVQALNLPGQYFQLVKPQGVVLALSKNLQNRPLDLGAPLPQGSQAVFRTVDDATRGRLRVVLVPFQRGSESCVLVNAISTRDLDVALGNFRRMILWLLPASLVLTAGISAWYVGRSLHPIADLTRQAARMTERIRDSSLATGELQQGSGPSLPVANSNDELGRLAETFNKLFARVGAALRQQTQFVSDASHELRTPLSVLQGETELVLSETRAAEEYQKALRVIESELKKLSRILEGLFTLAMADAGQLRLTPEPLYLNEVLEETCALVTPRAQAKNIVIERDLKKEVATQGDEALLRQLFLIFLENAIKYSPPNTRVRVGLENSSEVGRVRFQDEGIGISSEQLPHVFERFYRASPPDAGEAQSGGLGLSIAQAIARAQGGSIECKSELGVGSTFTIILPLHPPANRTANSS